MYQTLQRPIKSSGSGITESFLYYVRHRKAVGELHGYLLIRLIALDILEISSGIDQ